MLDKGNTVTESYACAILNSKEYCVRGGKDNNGDSFYGYAENETDYTGNMLIIKSLKDNGLVCDINDMESICNFNSDYLKATWLGVAYATDFAYECYVFENGKSYCDEYV